MRLDEATPEELYQLIRDVRTELRRRGIRTGRGISPDSKGAKIRALILKHFPDRVMPHGSYAAIADRFGVTRQYVGYQARQLGVRQTHQKDYV